MLALYVLATVQFVGSYLFLEFPYIDVYRFERGYERLPFQTRLLMAPLYTWVDRNHMMVDYASRLARNHYFFPTGIFPGEVLEFWLGIPCVLIAGWVAVRIYESATRQNLLKVLVYPVFLVLCVVSYVLHTVQNFRFVYDMPSLALFAIGLYLIYFRKPAVWFVALFALATLNRETTLLLLPFYLLRAAVDGRGQFNWRRMLAPQVAGVVLPLVIYWGAWHLIVFHAFQHNASEYYPRIPFNLHCFARLRYYPQLASTMGFLAPFLYVYRRQLKDPVLRVWLWVLPIWFVFMFTWGILVETRIYGELLPLVAPMAVLMGEELIVARVRQRDGASEEEEEEHRIHIARAA